MDQNLMALKLSQIGKKKAVDIFKKAVFFRKSSDIQLKEIAYKLKTHPGNVTKIENKIPTINAIARYLSALINLSGLEIDDFNY